ncbi:MULTISPECIES: bifunctional phosphoribosylaminoimidazolecarboxamide formyltransferase/IMP cyclohydrolase [Streptomyces]|uniref:bifunctional phosphoribosylaminoimidazolecarboxamide formyltransferase/IMP cyclohydrolase n=1 Tax=Streptomyces TaxID=1883 RepID=UPI000C280D63|nr:bifunctional phosphoribosylaminoimidazolecarboxamide formyltransferase/IMP cyclohydrolase [Streptomyces sp. CB01201]MBX7465769.1 bifunctional phosphoribosylaminoimidazolecarboxamide formyltransferase/IMP cyclohydrolase [Streptomyces sp. MAG02]PJM99878.1 bifunctional phosphoribosylaminoimidazolecarboxamide formyltransferase/IMP cyclohydrolase [Streptomyces sp. CB01201]
MSWGAWPATATALRDERFRSVNSVSTDTVKPIRRALVSVYDKTGLEELAQGLHAAGVELVSTGSTAAKIAAAGVPVTKVEELTGFPECLDGRVKTLHPKVHAGILADLRLDAHRAQLDELGVRPFELVVVNLYPFKETVASGASPDECVEQIDIGGPSMVRAAAKNHPSVAVVTSPGRYAAVLDAVKNGGFDLTARKRLAAEAFQHTAAYDVAVASWMTNVYAPEEGEAPLPEFLGATWERKSALRYGENPHQAAALYTDGQPGGLANAEQLHGKEMSFNNYVDTEAARRAAYDHDDPCVAIIKHANPCGIAVDADLAAAHRKAHECDPLSAFGGVIAVNRPVTVAMAEQVAEIFTEVIAAPDYEDGAVEVLARKKNIRVLKVAGTPHQPGDLKSISGGAVLQHTDLFQAEGDDPANWTLASGEALDEAELKELAFAWVACRAVKSNAILLAKDGASVGVGMGQVNRVDSAKLAVERAGEERARGSYAASDAFFPFPDGFEILANAGVKAVVQPGGSVRDELVVEAAKKAGVTMYFTGTRHFFH